MEIAWIVLGSVVSLAAVNFFTHLAEVMFLRRHRRRCDARQQDERESDRRD